MDREIELKLQCDPAALERVRHSRALAHVKRGRANAKVLRSVYFDTEDFALMKNGLALRVREVGGKRVQTLKTDSEGKGPATDRGEWEATLSASGDGPDLNRLPAALRARIRKAAGAEAISPRLVSDIHRTARLLKTRGGDEIELAIDRGVLRANGREEQVSELELELKRGNSSSLYRLALELADIVPLRVGMKSKAARAFALARNGKPEVVRAEPVAIPRGATVAEAYALILRQCLSHLLANEAAAFDGGSSEGLHQMRVALRRMRSAFVAFGDLLAGEAAEELAREAKWLTRAIGRARDFDVFLSDVVAPVAAGNPDDKSLAALASAAKKAREQAWASARAAVRSPRMTRFVLSLALYLDEESWTGDTNEEPAAEGMSRPVAAFAGDALDKRLKKVTKLARNIDRLDVSDRHELRKRLKKLRYTMTFFTSLFPRADTKGYLHHLARLQDVFGALNDLETAHTIVDELTRGHPRLGPAGVRVLSHHERRARKEWQSALRMWRNFRAQAPFWRQAPARR
jgi:inorganic triphosphatase YgiF